MSFPVKFKDDYLSGDGCGGGGDSVFYNRTEKQDGNFFWRQEEEEEEQQQQQHERQRQHIRPSIRTRGAVRTTRTKECTTASSLSLSLTTTKTTDVRDRSVASGETRHGIAVSSLPSSCSSSLWSSLPSDCSQDCSDSHRASNRKAAAAAAGPAISATTKDNGCGGGVGGGGGDDLDAVLELTMAKMANWMGTAASSATSGRTSLSGGWREAAAAAAATGKGKVRGRGAGAGAGGGTYSGGDSNPKAKSSSAAVTLKEKKGGTTTNTTTATTALKKGGTNERDRNSSVAGILRKSRYGASKDGSGSGDAPIGTMRSNLEPVTITAKRDESGAAAVVVAPPSASFSSSSSFLPTPDDPLAYHPADEAYFGRAATTKTASMTTTANIPSRCGTRGTTIKGDVIERDVASNADAIDAHANDANTEKDSKAATIAAAAMVEGYLPRTFAVPPPLTSANKREAKETFESASSASSSSLRTRDLNTLQSGATTKQAVMTRRTNKENARENEPVVVEADLSFSCMSPEEYHAESMIMSLEGSGQEGLWEQRWTGKKQEKEEEKKEGGGDVDNDENEDDNDNDDGNDDVVGDRFGSCHLDVDEQARIFLGGADPFGGSDSDSRGNDDNDNSKSFSDDDDDDDKHNDNDNENDNDKEGNIPPLPNSTTASASEMRTMTTATEGLHDYFSDPNMDREALPARDFSPFLLLWDAISTWSTPSTAALIKRWSLSSSSLEEEEEKEETEEMGRLDPPYDTSDIGASRCAGLMSMISMHLTRALSERRYRDGRRRGGRETEAPAAAAVLAAAAVAVASARTETRKGRSTPAVRRSRSSRAGVGGSSTVVVVGGGGSAGSGSGSGSAGDGHLRRRAEHRLAALVRTFDYSRPVVKFGPAMWRCLTEVLLEVALPLSMSHPSFAGGDGIGTSTVVMPDAVRDAGFKEEEWTYLTRKAIVSLFPPL